MSLPLVLEEVLGWQAPGRSPDSWLDRLHPLPGDSSPVVTGGRLANHSGGSVRDSHPLPSRPSAGLAPGHLELCGYDTDLTFACLSCQDKHRKRLDSYVELLQRVARTSIDC